MERDARHDPQPAGGGPDGGHHPHDHARLGRDPAVGASVMVTAITDTGGFFIFLGLATLFLLTGPEADRLRRLP